jgi:hypothetical protein
LTARIFKTTDGGGSWTRLAGAGYTGGFVLDMRWLDATTGVAAGNGGIHRTTNGGATWTRTLAASVDDLDFRDADVGFAVGYGGPGVYTWETTDGGVTWTPVALAWGAFPSGVAARPDGFAVCGVGNVILTARDASATGVPGPTPGDGAADADAAWGARPDAAARIAIAPNPTTGAVRMRFESGAAGLCEARIYDVAGRLVASFERPVASGSATIDWDARGAGGATRGDAAASASSSAATNAVSRAPHALAPGVYFVSIRDPAGAVRTGRFLLLAR